jgi:transposase InsO family protein
VKGVLELIQWINSALNGRSPGFIRVFKAKTAANARRFLRDLERACPIRIRTILTDNGKEFTDRLFGLRKRAATGAHEFDRLCADLGIEHRLTPPKSPQTNGMVERFNGRIEEVLQSHHFRSGEELEATLHRYVWLYNQQLPQSALGSHGNRLNGSSVACDG